MAATTSERRLPTPLHADLLRARDLLDRGYASPIDVPTAARTAHLSPAHFSRCFRQAFGETPHQYLRRRRIERAKELLRGTSLTVTEVSVAIGFRSLGSFSTAFRELVGTSPSTTRGPGAGPARPRFRPASRSCSPAPETSSFREAPAETAA